MRRLVGPEAASDSAVVPLRHLALLCLLDAAVKQRKLRFAVHKPLQGVPGGGRAEPGGHPARCSAAAGSCNPSTLLLHLQGPCSTHFGSQRRPGSCPPQSPSRARRRTCGQAVGQEGPSFECWAGETGGGAARRAVQGRRAGPTGGSLEHVDGPAQLVCLREVAVDDQGAPPLRSERGRQSGEVRRACQRAAGSVRSPQRLLQRTLVTVWPVSSSTTFHSTCRAARRAAAAGREAGQRGSGTGQPAGCCSPPPAHIQAPAARCSARRGAQQQQLLSKRRWCPGQRSRSYLNAPAQQRIMHGC